MADRLADGRLAQIITEKRADDQSYDRIIRDLYADFGIEVSRPTLLKWARSLGVAESDKAAS